MVKINLLELIDHMGDPSLKRKSVFIISVPLWETQVNESSNWLYDK